MAVLVSDDAYRCEECRGPWMVVWWVAKEAKAWAEQKYPEGATHADLVRATLRSEARRHARTHRPTSDVRAA